MKRSTFPLYPHAAALPRILSAALAPSATPELSSVLPLGAGTASLAGFVRRRLRSA